MRAGSAKLEINAPYAERSSRKLGKLDRSLLSIWGAISPRAISSIARRPLQRLAECSLNHDRELRALTDRALRSAADNVRAKLISDPYDYKSTALCFGLAREAAGRHIGKRHYSSQLIGGAAMMRGAIAEMQTGEGKTLTALLPAVAAGLANRPVHVITVNEYLASRDAEHLRPVYEALGLSVGLVQTGQSTDERRAAYAQDVTYCTNKDLVFDYLRDRMAMSGRRSRARRLVGEVFQSPRAETSALLLRGLSFGIVDEADSVLIDEARTPLILAGSVPTSDSDRANSIVALEIAEALVPSEDFDVHPQDNAAALSNRGRERIADLSKGQGNLWEIRRAREELVSQALSALYLFRKDTNYIVQDGKIQIVDEFTGRVMPDRSWERGLHQMIEAKEGCEQTDQRRTLAQITYQRFFTRYLHLCGMTGTATEAAGELRSVYDLPVIRIPTNKPVQRSDKGTRLFRRPEDKWKAVVETVRAEASNNRAILIGTRSVEASEMVGNMLKDAGILAAVLNARQDKEEAEIVARAGSPGRVTVATNMAGRGTDIELHPDTRRAGGLHVILTEFHESPRIDRQLFGRAGRQGDPGSYEAIVSLADDMFFRFTAAWLRYLVEQFALNSRELPVLLCLIHRRLCQSSAERIHFSARREALLSDERFQETLSFAGRGE